MKFTFKTERPTGKWKYFQATYHYIKLQKKEVGTIEDHYPHNIRLMVIKKDILEDGNKNCTWKWIKLGIDFNTTQDAKEYLNKYILQITSKYNLYKMES